MRTVISCSRRTDVPAFYMRWLLSCLEKGTAEVVNPVTHKPHEVDIRPGSVHTIVLWSKNFGPFLKNRDAFRDYRLYFQFTINEGGEIEPNVIDTGRRLDQLRELGRIYGPERINWRFDPVTFWDGGNRNNIGRFEEIAEAVAKTGVRRCTISFTQWYAKVKKRMESVGLAWYDPPLERKLEIVSRIAEYCDRLGTEVRACCNDYLLDVPGIGKASCIDGPLLAELAGEPCSSARDRSQRDECRCTKSYDIGSYTQVCYHSCVYCYANPAMGRHWGKGIERLRKRSAESGRSGR
jgi:hypothetical protein